MERGDYRQSTRVRSGQTGRTAAPSCWGGEGWGEEGVEGVEVEMVEGAGVEWGRGWRGVITVGPLV